MNIRTGLLGLLLLFLVVAISGCASDIPLEEAKASIQTPDIIAIPDGTYRGAAFRFPVNVRLAVRIENARIVSIDLLEHFNGKGKAAEAILDSVIAAQSLDVDVISGATHSSVTILQALEAALKAGIGGK